MGLPPISYTLVTGLYHDPPYGWKGNGRVTDTKGFVQYDTYGGTILFQIGFKEMLHVCSAHFLFPFFSFFFVHLDRQLYVCVWGRLLLMNVS